MTNNKPVLLIIGGRGFIGERLSEAAAADWEVWIASPSAVSEGGNCIALDVRDREGVREAFEAASPTLVAHLAAISDIDRCEREPGFARAVNVEGTRNVVNECLRSGAGLVFTSTSAIFDGLKHGYAEEDPAAPLSVYGRTKLEAEQVVCERLPSAIILRMSLVLGVSERKDTNSVLSRWVAAWRDGRAVTALTSEYRNPVDAGTLARVILDLGLNRNATGAYHVGAADSMSRYEITRRTAEALGYSPSLVVPRASPPPARAARGRDHFLRTERIRRICDVPLGNVAEVIRRSALELTESPLRTRI